MDWTPYLVVALGSVVIPSLGYLVNSTITVKSRLDVHIAEDEKVQSNITETLKQLHQGQRDTGEKLDRLIDRFL